MIASYLLEREKKLATADEASNFFSREKTQKEENSMFFEDTDKIQFLPKFGEKRPKICEKLLQNFCEARLDSL